MARTRCKETPAKLVCLPPDWPIYDSGEDANSGRSFVVMPLGEKSLQSCRPFQLSV